MFNVPPRLPVLSENPLSVTVFPFLFGWAGEGGGTTTSGSVSGLGRQRRVDPTEASPESRFLDPLEGRTPTHSRDPWGGDVDYS